MQVSMRPRPVRFLAVAFLLVGAWAVRSAWLVPSAAQAPTQRPIVITASKYRFDPPRIEVFQGDLVRIQLSTTDIAHSFTVDAYRIAKRVNPGKSVEFEFQADKPGTFPFYCSLEIDSGCRQMRGELVVRPRP